MDADPRTHLVTLPVSRELYSELVTGMKLGPGVVTLHLERDDSVEGADHTLTIFVHKDPIA